MTKKALRAEKREIKKHEILMYEEKLARFHQEQVQHQPER